MNNKRRRRTRQENSERSDNLTPSDRLRAMKAVRSTNTAPERRIRVALATHGINFICQGDLPGRPDFLLPGLGVALFVHGCFWHSHGCRTAIPKSNRSYWLAKLGGNIKRDRLARRALQKGGWRVSTLWECRIPTHECAMREVAKLLARVGSSQAGRRHPRHE